MSAEKRPPHQRTAAGLLKFREMKHEGPRGNAPKGPWVVDMQNSGLKIDNQKLSGPLDELPADVLASYVRLRGMIRDGAAYVMTTTTSRACAVGLMLSTGRFAARPYRDGLVIMPARRSGVWRG